MTDEDYDRMGADRKKVLPPEQFHQALTQIVETPDAQKKTAYMVWLVDGRAIGFSSLKRLVYGESGEMHLHMWDPTARGKGYGPVLFCLSAVEFYKRFALKHIKCEPRVSNPFPNRMFQKIGFPLVRTHTAASSELSIVCELNEYAVHLETAKDYLLRR